jgi:hypothetical protein
MGHLPAHLDRARAFIVTEFADQVKELNERLVKEAEELTLN